MRKGYVLIELIVSMTILAIVLPSIFRTLTSSIQAIKEIRYSIDIQRERLYAFQVFLSDIYQCKDLRNYNNQLVCIQNEKEVRYSCTNYKLKRKVNTQVMYLTKKMKVDDCLFSLKNGVVNVNISSFKNNIIWELMYE